MQWGVPQVIWSSISYLLTQHTPVKCTGYFCTPYNQMSLTGQEPVVH